MTDSARSTLTRMTEIPAEYWIALAAVVIVGSIAAALVRAPWDETADTSPLDDRDEYARRADIAKRRTRANEARMRAAGDQPWWRNGGAA